MDGPPTPDLTRHFRNMALAVFVAFRALQNGETPVACVFVHGPSQAILAYGCNDTNRSLNGTRHAEFLGIDALLARHGLLGAPAHEIAAFFADVWLYVTIEPCVMCALALQHIGIGRVYFGAANDRFGGNGTVLRVQGAACYRSMGGIMRPEAIALLRQFYVQENGSAPVPKAKKNKDIEGKEFPANLDFRLYVSEPEFCREMGPQRAARFYHAPNPQEEITPVLGAGYGLRSLITEDHVRQMPAYERLYPDSPCEIATDLARLAAMLPTITDAGVVDLGGKADAKKRRLHGPG
ncbi:cytidine deaminase-like protein [Metschnikowia bicuspidata var. bicuspidata NRRL YB-4993]|uniref:Cytidine deaminase-like protein n=1 Tax=Metschnikowia bicuspidata var. bicuspidata NRRL YB-4993 TaxID=869754 RepID=A0A1A0H9K1_9ASCO|nr:cytidine deaminase-like protein [Metschnikowia bicuspidata var. bicuspidata NRRL YB-4993]OBA20804.1 cytidine deaminase-like protein [Metschnikowia bicuspidata var. bicuspidata NRRL YB-4993]